MSACGRVPPFIAGAYRPGHPGASGQKSAEGDPRLLSDMELRLNAALAEIKRLKAELSGGKPSPDKDASVLRAIRRRL